MNEPENPAPQESTETPPSHPPAVTGSPTPRHERSPLPVLCAIGFALLAIGLFFVWQNPNVPAQIADAGPQLQAQAQQIASLEARIRQIEQRPAPPPAASPADLARLGQRVDALEVRQNADPAQVAQRLDVMSGRIEGLTGRLQTGQDQEKQQLDALSARIAALEKVANDTSAVSDRLARVARLQDAAIALASGKPVGEIPNAPAALAKYARQAPPTQAQLRLAFPQAAQAALAAEQPDLANAPLVDRVLEKAQGLITVRRGDEIVVGNQTATILNEARADLDAGDLPAAVGALSRLPDAPRRAMASWLNDAQSLLAARAALAGMAGQA